MPTYLKVALITFTTHIRKSGKIEIWRRRWMKSEHWFFVIFIPAKSWTLLPQKLYQITFLFCTVFTSVARLGDFWKLLAIKFLAKEAQMIGNFLGSFE